MPTNELFGELDPSKEIKVQVDTTGLNPSDESVVTMGQAGVALSPQIKADQNFPMGQPAFVLADHSVESALNATAEATLDQGVTGPVSNDLTDSVGSLNPQARHPVHETGRAFSNIMGYSEVIAERMQIWTEAIQFQATVEEASAIVAGGGLLQAVAGFFGGLGSVVYAALSGELNSTNLPEIKGAITRYIQFEAAAGQHLAQTSCSLVQDYGEGHCVFDTRSVHQHSAYQHRFIASSLTVIDSPYIEMTAQHVLHRSRYHHTTSDFFRGQHEYFWVRAEDFMGLTSRYHARTAVEALRDVSSMIESIAERQVQYGGRVWRQAGQWTFTPICPFNVVSLLTNLIGYGTMIDIALIHKASFAKFGAQVISAGMLTVMDSPITFINCFGITSPPLKMFDKIREPGTLPKYSAAGGKGRSQEDPSKNPLPPQYYSRKVKSADGNVPFRQGEC